MQKFVLRVGLAAVVAAVTVLGLGAAVFIGTAAAANDRAVPAHGGGPGGWGGPGIRSTGAREAAAEALGMTVDELTTQLRAGESLADLAEAAGVDMQAVLDAIDAANQDAQREAIEQAVTDGDLTREHADWLLEGLDAGYWGAGGHGPGFGPRGFGGGHGRNGGEQPRTMPTTES